VRKDELLARGGRNLGGALHRAGDGPRAAKSQIADEREKRPRPASPKYPTVKDRGLAC